MRIRVEEDAAVRVDHREPEAGHHHRIDERLQRNGQCRDRQRAGRLRRIGRLRSVVDRLRQHRLPRAGGRRHQWLEKGRRRARMAPVLEILAAVGVDERRRERFEHQLLALCAARVQHGERFEERIPLERRALDVEVSCELVRHDGAGPVEARQHTRLELPHLVVGGGDLLVRLLSDARREVPQLIVEHRLEPRVGEQVERRDGHQRDAEERAQADQYNVLGPHALRFADERQLEERPTEEREQQQRHQERHHREGDRGAGGGHRSLLHQPDDHPPFGRAVVADHARATGLGEQRVARSGDADVDHRRRPRQVGEVERRRRLGVDLERVESADLQPGIPGLKDHAAIVRRHQHGAEDLVRQRAAEDRLQQVVELEANDAACAGRYHDRVVLL